MREAPALHVGTLTRSNVRSPRVMRHALHSSNELRRLFGTPAHASATSPEMCISAPALLAGFTTLDSAAIRRWNLIASLLLLRKNRSRE